MPEPPRCRRWGRAKAKAAEAQAEEDQAAEAQAEVIPEVLLNTGVACVEALRAPVDPGQWSTEDVVQWLTEAESGKFQRPGPYTCSVPRTVFELEGHSSNVQAASRSVKEAM